ncbi:translation initiation inhibitor, partial [Thraustotheca clavata]
MVFIKAFRALNTSEIKRLHVEKRLSEVVIHNKIVYLSGQLADNLNGDIKCQTKENLDSVDQFLADAGTDKSKIIVGMNAVWDESVVPGCTSARAT